MARKQAGAARKRASGFKWHRDLLDVGQVKVGGGRLRVHKVGSFLIASKNKNSPKFLLFIDLTIAPLLAWKARTDTTDELELEY